MSLCLIRRLVAPFVGVSPIIARGAFVGLQRPLWAAPNRGYRQPRTLTVHLASPACAASGMSGYRAPSMREPTRRRRDRSGWRLHLVLTRRLLDPRALHHDVRAVGSTTPQYLSGVRLHHPLGPRGSDTARKHEVALRTVQPALREQSPSVVQIVDSGTLSGHAHGMDQLRTALDGDPHTGTVLDLSPSIRKWTVGGVTYCDTGHIHVHEQHCLVRWFRRA